MLSVTAYVVGIHGKVPNIDSEMGKLHFVSGKKTLQLVYKYFCKNSA